MAVADNWGKVVDGVKQYPVHKYQELIINSEVRFTAAIAGTGGGKTVIGPLWVAKKIAEIKAENPDRQIKGMIVAPTYKVLLRATVPCLIETFKGTALEGVYKETKNVYQMYDGSVIWCQGADNPGGLEGGQFDFVWGDEAGQFKLATWIAIQGRTGQKQAPVLFTTTPYGKNWLFHEFFERFQDGDPNYFVVQWASKENPAYPEEEYNRAKEVMGLKGIMRYDGVFLQMEGLVYPDMYTCKTDMSLDDIFAMPGRFYGGIDYGWNDPFCAVCGLLDQDDCLWIWYERYKSETPIERHADKLPKFKNKRIIWYSDNVPEYIHKLRRGGHNVRTAMKAIVPGIDAVNKRINTGKLKVVGNRCPAIFAEAELYAYPEKDEQTVGDKPDRNCPDHAMDALRYLVAGIDLRRAA